MPKIENIIEATLFISARPMTVSEIAKITGIRPKSRIKATLDKMRKSYDHHGIYIEERDGLYELKVKNEHLDVVSSLAPNQDFSRAVLQTLSIIAYKNPIKQSDIIQIRGNRAYDHISELESRGFVIRVPSGHTNMVKITGKFLEYFGIQNKADLAKYFKSSNLLNDAEDDKETDRKVPKVIKKEYDPEIERRKFHEKLKDNVDKRKKELHKEKEDKGKSDEHVVQD